MCIIKSLKVLKDKNTVFIDLFQVSIEGSRDIHVKSFQVHSSDDNIMWMVYKDKTTGTPKVSVEISHDYFFSCWRIRVL